MGLTAKGEANGLATLDDDGKLPAGQLPSGQGAQAGAVADQVALTAAAAAGANPTKAEFDKVVADAVAARTTLNALLAVMRTAGLLHT